MSSHDELACTYSALILCDDDVPITAEKITTILKASNVQFEPIWPTLFAKALSGNVKDLLANVGSSAGPAPAAPAAASGAAAPAAKKEEKKEEKKKEESEEEDDADMGFGLFD